MSTRNIIIGLLTLLSLNLHAQGIPTEGTDYYLGYIYPPHNDVVPEQTATTFLRSSVYISSYQTNVVTVSYFDPTTHQEGATQTYPISAGSTLQIALDRTKLKMNSVDIGEYRACHIKAQKPINVQFFSVGANSGGSYMALPVNAWGKEYVVASYKDNGTSLGSGGETVGMNKGSGVFMIVAAYDSTQITITPTARTTGGHPGVHQGTGATGQPQPYTGTMHRGQCWIVKSQSALDNGSDDISASIVRSSKPVAVIAGHENAMTGNGNTGSYNTEGRDYMIEQMIPVESWDNTGYITLPMGDSFSSNGSGLGEDVRMFVSNTVVPDTIIVNRGTSSASFANLSPYAAPPEINNIDQPAHYSSDTGKFMVMQYDLRNHGTKPPYPTPSMMSIIPRSHWRNSYLWHVPYSSNEGMQRYYVTIVAPKDGVPLYYFPKDTILSKNWYSDSLRVAGIGTPVYNKIASLGSLVSTWSTIPGHPDLKAATFNLSSSRTYYLKAPFPFMAYFFGQRAVSTDNFLSNGANDYYFSFAAPLGMTKDEPSVRRLRVTVDTLCTSWRVCVYDSNPGGIRSVALLNDAFGDIVVGGNFRYRNVSFDPVDDPQNLRELTFQPAKKEACFTVRVDDIDEDAYAPLYIIDANGSAKIVELQFKKTAVIFQPPDTVGLPLKPFNEITKKYEPSYIDEEVCKEYLFINMQTSTKAYVLQRAEVPAPSSFRVKNVTPPIGSIIGQGDTVVITVCFSGADRSLHRDTIEFATDCFTRRLPLLGQAGTGLITADDHHFGVALVGTTTCTDIEVQNIGEKAFTLDENWIMSKAEEFTFDTTHPKNKLPVTILPGKSHQFWFCFSPRTAEASGAHMFWSTDIREPFAGQVKSFSDLSGSGINPGLNWDRESVILSSSGSRVVKRVALVNSGSAEVQLTRIWIEGLDADEFEVFQTEHNTNPPTWGGSIIPVGDSMWVDIEFDPDLSKEPRFRTRVASLRSSSVLDSSLITSLILTGLIFIRSVDEDPNPLGLRLHPNPAREEMTVSLSLERAGEVQVHIFDILGREVSRMMRTDCNAGMNSLHLTLPNIENGSYVVQVVAEGKVQTMALEICR